MRRLFFTVLVVALVAVLIGVAPSRAGQARHGAGAQAAPTGTEPNTTEAGEGVVVEAKFVSALGWVKPGEGYPFRVLLHNHTASAAEDVSVTMPAPDGAVFLTTSDPAAAVTADQITWSPGTLPAGSADAPSTTTLVVEARSKSLGEDAQIVWKDLSAAATLTYAGGPAGGVTSTTHGPKVIPLDPAYDTARYGDRPFPVVPVAYVDRAAQESAEDLARTINDPATPGSTYNLFQELSFGQLFPQASVPSAGIASADFAYEPGFGFTQLDPATVNTCTGGATLAQVPETVGSPLYPERIVDGWYQLPGNTAYYGADANGSALVGALTGIGALQAIDSGCGPTGKAVFDAAQIADPEIDYDEFDTDKDGVVDFFMMVFTGLGGNGVSQGLACDPTTGSTEECPVPPYDNIWPHSSSLEFGYVDPITGLGGYQSDDQLHDLEGAPQCWVDDAYLAKDTCAAAGGGGDDGLPVFVRVGPYNVNPETAIDKASVISHEYGHSLGLPDFYSTGSRSTYGDFNLMATDKSQGMDVFSRQDLGWVVPSPLETGSYSDLPESDTDIHRIDWETPTGEPYTLEGPNVHNGPAWMAKLPSRRIIDSGLVADQASASHVWWSQSGNDFGCSPTGGHNFDIYLPELADVAPGSDVRLAFKSNFDIEWDYDYGFVLVSSDGGRSFTSLESLNGYTTPATQNPNANTCQSKYGNGITGHPASYDAGTAPVDRVLANYGEPTFVDDAYDLSSMAGEEIVLRFSYATDPGLARPGWFIDDLTVSADGEPVYETDFESSGSPDDERVFNGGCREGLGALCTDGWQYVDSSAGSPADHGYYLELRDRSSFDLDGKGENDREPIAFEPGLLLVYTDEAHGYGNVGTDDPPAQSPLDSRPEPGNGEPDLDDATFTAAEGRTHFDDQDWIDNYEDPRRDEQCLADCDNPLLAHVVNPWLFDFDCLGFDVTSMTGDDVGPETAPGDLTASLDVDLGAGCRAFDYGRGASENHAPTAVAQAKATAVEVGEEVVLDGSASYDDQDAPGALALSWDTDGDGAPDAEGATTTAAFDTPGEHVVVLSATDSSGLSSTDEVTITVGEPAEPVPAPVAGRAVADPALTRTADTPARATLPATGSDAGPVLGLLALAALALAARRIAAA